MKNRPNAVSQRNGHLSPSLATCQIQPTGSGHYIAIAAAMGYVGDPSGYLRAGLGCDIAFDINDQHVVRLKPVMEQGNPSFA